MPTPQGLIYRGGFLYESTGRNGQSTLRKVTLETGAVVQQRRIDAAHFAEGLTVEGPAVPAHVAVERGVRLRPRHLRAGEDVALSQRRLGADRSA